MIIYHYYSFIDILITISDIYCFYRTLKNWSRNKWSRNEWTNGNGNMKCDYQKYNKRHDKT